MIPPQLIVSFVALFIFSLPMALTATPFFVLEATWAKIAWAVCSPAFFSFTFMLTAGVCSRFFQAGVVKGKFPRQLSHPVYFARRMYGLCWTMVFYCTPLYALCLTIPTFKKVLFRLFGYKTTLNFVTYPDTWIRDLPLLKIGEGAYLANKSPIGTNIWLMDGDILVDRVKIGDGSILGHLAMLGGGATVGDKCEIGIGAAVGLRAKLHHGAKVSSCASVNHGAELGLGVDIGAGSYIGVKAIIRDGIKVPGGANSPAGAIISTQQDLEHYISSETNMLTRMREQMVATMAAGPMMPPQHPGEVVQFDDLRKQSR